MTKAKSYLVGNILIQLAWIALSITIGVVLAYRWEPTKGTFLVAVCLSVVIYGGLNFLGNIFDAWRRSLNDPDVQAASTLRMSVRKYHKYKELYDAHWEVMMRFGPNSSEAEKFFAKEVYPNLPNLDEWRIYQEYRGILQRKEQEEEIRRILSRENKPQQWKPTSIHDAFGLKNQHHDKSPK